MPPVVVTLAVQQRDIPDLICFDPQELGPIARAITRLAEAVADELGVREYLGRPDRADELRRRLWEYDNGHPSVVSPPHRLQEVELIGGSL